VAGKLFEKVSSEGKIGDLREISSSVEEISVWIWTETKLTN
jgi:hypothetical protein